MLFTILFLFAQSPAHAARTSCPGMNGAQCAVFQLTNAERAKEGLPPMAADPQCQRAAQAHAEDMGKRHYYAHLSPEGRDVGDRYHGAWAMIGENIVAGADLSPSAAVASWMNSRGHRRNILSSSFTRMGMGVARIGKMVYYAQCFMEPRDESSGGGLSLFIK